MEYGFRQGRYSETQLITAVEDILYVMDHHQQVDLVLLDFRKAFDTMPHCRLLSKLSSFGIHTPRVLLGCLLGVVFIDWALITSIDKRHPEEKGSG